MTASATTHYFFVGIGGIGMSGLARLLAHRGHQISGSDRDRSLITDALEREGIHVVYTQDEANITSDIDEVVYSKAVPKEHPELTAAREKGILLSSYAEKLGAFADSMKTVAVSGTHGKTTTTAMIATVLDEAGYEPNALVGSLLAGDTDGDWAGNVLTGDSQTFVVEADEYKRSFLSLSPQILVITNIEADHLDYYRDLEEIQDAFRQLAERVPDSGAIICDPHDPAVEPVVANTDARVIDRGAYTVSPDELSVPGVHNRQNAAAALAVAGICGLDDTAARKGLRQFRGTWRRFEYKGELSGGGSLYDDYAHHPAEVSTTLAGFRERYPDSRLRVIFQPHLYSRTAQLADEFAESFAAANEVIVAPIYAAREDPAEKLVDHHDLAASIRSHHDNVHALDSNEGIIEQIRDGASAADIVVTMGAGDIYHIADDLLDA